MFNSSICVISVYVRIYLSIADLFTEIKLFRVSTYGHSMFQQ